MSKTRHFLVTGGSGFIGSAVVRALVDAGNRVRSLDNDSRGSRGNLVGIPGVDIVTGDIRDALVVARAVKGIDCVCHLAAVNGTENFYSKPDLVLEVAVKGMVNVLDACRIEGVRDIVVMSSSEVYQSPSRVPTSETVPLVVPDPLNPRYSYGGGKIVTELLALHAGKHFDRVRVVRPHNVYGPRMGWEHVIPQLTVRIVEAAKGNGSRVKLPIQGTGNETRAFVFINDFVDGFLKVVDRGEARGIYHIGTAEEITIATLAKKIGKCLGFDVEVQPGKLTPGSTPRRCPDITKARELGYRPRVSLDDGLAVTVQWYAEHAAERPAAA